MGYRDPEVTFEEELDRSEPLGTGVGGDREVVNDEPVCSAVSQSSSRMDKFGNRGPYWGQER